MSLQPGRYSHTCVPVELYRQRTATAASAIKNCSRSWQFIDIKSRIILVNAGLVDLFYSLPKNVHLHLHLHLHVHLLHAERTKFAVFLFKYVFTGTYSSSYQPEQLVKIKKKNTTTSSFSSFLLQEEHNFSPGMDSIIFWKHSFWYKLVQFVGLSMSLVGRCPCLVICSEAYTFSCSPWLENV